MTRKDIIKEIFLKVIVPVCVALLLFFTAKAIFTKDGVTDYLLVWIFCGVPFGIRKMFLWLIPRNFGIAGTVGVIALNFIIGGLIGGVVLIWRLGCAVYYLIKDIILLIRFNTNSARATDYFS